jgi:undecaprenyl diphosphate synthase
MKYKGELFARRPPMEADITTPHKKQSGFSRLPRHIGIIPDGNRRWADFRNAPRRNGYAAGIGPGMRLLQLCRELGVEEASVYGFTKENVRRPSDQVEAFRQACIDFVDQAVAAGVALQVIGDSASSVFPQVLKQYAERRSSGDMKVNLLVNYGWRWDLATALTRVVAPNTGPSALLPLIGSSAASRVDLVVRWGGRRRLSGFLPIQCAYADLYVIDTLWPDMELEEFIEALRWYEQQDVTLGG